MTGPPGRMGATGITGKGALVIFGSSGNLATTRIIPAAMRLRRRGSMPGSFLILGIDKEPLKGARQIPGFRFIRGDFGSRSTFSALGKALAVIAKGTEPEVMYYLATRPELFAGIVSRLQKEGLCRSKLGDVTVMVEKPFGTDLGSAQVLESRLRAAFPQRNIFRVDHFLGKSGTGQIRRARDDSPRLERVWNRSFIDHVQIMADESLDVGERGGFYDSVGAVRDMVQSHLFQLLCLVAMEPPESAGPAEVARSKARVLRAMVMPSNEEVVWGQYKGYNQSHGVKEDTRTPTFVALKVTIDNARWMGVPFYLRTGKALARTATEVVVVFRDQATLPKEAQVSLSSIRFCIDPLARMIVEPKGVGTVASWKGPRHKADEYETLLLEAFNGSQASFVDAGFNLIAWRLLEPLLRGWEKKTHPLEPAPYECGTWGPSAADGLLAAEGRSWRDGRRSRRSC
ncbi:MAG TPA: glucose-6-phosphate dehydrogenase [Nitrososphaerales archaeon]|nr:glucose-6-phosphate dehydrogenase [Nitrososphaerales archaeon]